MQIIEEPMRMQELAAELRSEGKRISLVSTSGALNAGHAALIGKARETADAVVVSTFVNPLEFGPNEDFAKYPRNKEGDEEFCRQASVDVLFRPSAAGLLREGFSITVAESAISRSLCGISRPNPFRISVTPGYRRIMSPSSSAACRRVLTSGWAN